jgi:hypothetical protein
MAHSDKNIVIIPNKSSTIDNPKIVFSGADASSGPNNITLYAYPDNNGTLSFEGSAGQLFSITNDLSGVLFSVNDVSGFPALEVNATGTITMAQYYGSVGIGKSNPSYLLDVNGTVNATIFNSASDVTLKTNIENFDGIKMLDSINPVSFNWKEDGKKSYGVIAQELEKVLPELVDTNNDGVKSVAYIPMIAMLIDVVKKQQKDIEELKILLDRKNN